MRHAKGDADGVKLAAECDLVVVVVGNPPEGGGPFGKATHPTYGKEAVDRSEITLPEEPWIAEVLDANPRTVVVLVASFPYAIGWTKEHAPAIVHLTHNSQEMGNALADVLFGDVNPGGRLVQTWPRSLADLPPMLDYDLRHGRTYLYFEGDPLFPFGFGLSYTTFAYSNLRTARDRVDAKRPFDVLVDVANTGGRAGDEVVQLYARYVSSRVKRPLQQLVAFRRVTLAAGETRTVTLPVDVNELAYWDVSSQGFVVEPGEIEVRVGRSSRDIELTKTLVVEARESVAVAATAARRSRAKLGHRRMATWVRFGPVRGTLGSATLPRLRALVVACASSPPAPALEPVAAPAQTARPVVAPPPAENTAQPDAGAVASEPAAPLAEPSPPPEPAVAKRSQTPVNMLTARDAAFLVDYANSDAKQKAQTSCEAETKGDAEKQGACLAKARDKFLPDVLRFRRESETKVSMVIYKRNASSLRELWIGAVELSEPTPDSVKVKLKGSQKGTRPLFQGRSEVVISVPNEYSLELDDPLLGKLRYDAKIGLVTD